jgi:hypothetical protein
MRGMHDNRLCVTGMHVCERRACHRVCVTGLNDNRVCVTSMHNNRVYVTACIHDNRVFVTGMHDTAGCV